MFECVYKRVEANSQAAHDEQDLTAQQRAATSAAIAAGIGGATLVTSIVGLWFLLRTINQGQAALERAREANRIAEDSAQRERRAYIAIYPNGGTIKVGENVIIPLTMENFGNTPASQISILGGLCVQNMPVAPEVIHRPDDPMAPAFILFPTQTTTSRMQSDFVLSQWHYDGIIEGRAALVVYGTVDYIDCFGKHRTTDFHYHFTGPACKDTGRFNTSPFGNDWT